MIHYDLFDYLRALAGGILIGISVSLMLLFSGRVTGISGILYRGITSMKVSGWRWLFIFGLLVGGFCFRWMKPELIIFEDSRSWPHLIVAGLLVGFGSTLGSGCTSGHGVCGISRLSPRSLIATAIFMCAGALVVYFFQSQVLGGL